MAVLYDPQGWAEARDVKWTPDFEQMRGAWTWDVYFLRARVPLIYPDGRVLRGGWKAHRPTGYWTDDDGSRSCVIDTIRGAMQARPERDGALDKVLVERSDRDLAQVLGCLGNSYIRPSKESPTSITLIEPDYQAARARRALQFPALAPMLKLVYDGLEAARTYTWKVCRLCGRAAPARRNERACPVCRSTWSKDQVHRRLGGAPQHPALCRGFGPGSLSIAEGLDAATLLAPHVGTHSRLWQPEFPSWAMTFPIKDADAARPHPVDNLRRQ